VIPKLSIITINYNNAKGLLRTIESVLGQTFIDFEYIIIDGGSTDGSKELIQRYTERFSYWVSERDGGIYAAMNKGILKARGEYVQFLNSGDWLTDVAVLEKVFRTQPSADIVYGNMIKIFPDGRQVVDKGPQRSNLTLGDMYFHTLNHSSAFIRRTLFEMHGLYQEKYKIVSDWAFFFKVIGVHHVPVRYIDIDINYFDMTGISNAQRPLRDQEKKQELLLSMPAHLYPDYQKMEELIGKANIFDRLKNQKMLWQVIRIYNKIVRHALWMLVLFVAV